MYIDLFLKGGDLTEDEVIDGLFRAIDARINGICVPDYFVPLVRSILPKNMILSTPVDYPSGNLDSKVRQHQLLSVIKKGITAADIVINPHNICHKRIKSLTDDICSIIEISNKYDITIRVMLEYRLFSLTKLEPILKIINEAKVEYVFPSTGNMIDDYMDNLIFAAKIGKKYPNINMITNGNIWQKKQYDTIKKSEIFGMRLHSSNALTTIFGV